MSLTDVEQERLDVAEHHVHRLVLHYKSRKPRKGKELERLKLFEQALANLEAARLL